MRGVDYILIGAFVFAVDGQAVSVRAQNRDERFPLLPEFTCDGGTFGLKLPRSLKAVKRLGVVKQQMIGEQEDWGDHTASDVLFRFDGLELVLRVLSNFPDQVVVSSAVISKRDWRPVSPFYVGQTVQQALGVLGNVADGDPNLTQSYGSETSDVRFLTQDGRIKKIVYDCYTG